jgi:hypothetical protein
MRRGQPVNRTQIYLTDKQLAALRSLSRNTGLTQSELIRQAVDRFVDKHRPGDRKVLMRAAKGLWRERTDLPDFTALRREWDRTGL